MLAAQKTLKHLLAEIYNPFLFHLLEIFGAGGQGKTTPPAGTRSRRNFTCLITVEENDHRNLQHRPWSRKKKGPRTQNFTPTRRSFQEKNPPQPTSNPPLTSHRRRERPTWDPRASHGLRTPGGWEWKPQVPPGEHRESLVSTWWWWGRPVAGRATQKMLHEHIYIYNTCMCVYIYIFF